MTNLKRQGYYQLTLNFYFDRDHSLIEQDEAVIVGLFDKSNNQLLDSLILPLYNYVDINVKDSFCDSIRLNSRRLIYSSTVYLSPRKYDGSQGFYVVWERCCRNQTIANITDPIKTGTTIYSEFPPVSTPDSSPEFGMPAQNGFVCTGKDFKYSFGAVDADKDDLTYELAVPFKSLAGQGDPVKSPEPGPYQEVTLAQGISIGNLIPGPNPAKINSATGELSFTSNDPGNYVFSVICKEYRQGVYLGQVKKDYQLAVISCRSNTTPELKVLNPVTGGILADSDTLHLDLRKEHCLSAIVVDSLKGQQVYLYIPKQSFRDTVQIDPNFYITQSVADTNHINICIPSCLHPKTNTNHAFYLVLANVNNCTTPKYDTAYIVVKNTYQPREPLLSTSLASNEIDKLVGEQVSFTVTGIGYDSNLVYMTSKGVKDRIPSFSLTGINVLMSTVNYLISCQDLKASPLSYCVRIRDSSCYLQQHDSLCIDIKIRDTVNTQFNPVNIFTPNEDGVNDFFDLPGLPPDNCSEHFSKICIYNRWGAKVFEDRDRYFQWDAKNIPDGLYYYDVRYNSLIFKGWVQVLR